MTRVLLLLLLLTACQRTSDWHYCHIKGTGGGDLTNLTYRSADGANGIDLEFLCHGDELSTFLQVHSEPISPTPHDPEKAEVRIHANGKTVSFLASIREGSHRLRLSTVLQGQLVSLLRGGNVITIEFSGYKVDIEPSDFERQFAKLRTPPMQIPFHLFF